MELAKKKYAGHVVFYFPLDFTWAVKAAMRRIRPDAVVLAELELWPNLVWAAKRHGARVAVINGRLSQKSYEGYRRIRWFIARMLSHVDLLAAQDETLRRALLRPRRAAGSGPRHRLDEIRRRTSGSRQPGYPPTRGVGGDRKR